MKIVSMQSSSQFEKGKIMGSHWIILKIRNIVGEDREDIIVYIAGVINSFMIISSMESKEFSMSRV